MPKPKLPRGIYLTTYGNAAYVSGPGCEKAYDLDSAESIPMSMVTDQWVRKADKGDRPDRRSGE